MTNIMIDFIDSQAKRDTAGVEFTNINTILNDYEERGSDYGS